MHWLKDKRITIWITDPEVEALFRQQHNSPGISALAHLSSLKKNPLRVKQFGIIENFEQIERLGVNRVLRAITSRRNDFLENLDEAFGSDVPYLYRGIDFKHYKRVLQYGTARAEYTPRFQEQNLNQDEVIWASPSYKKAWEYIWNKNPRLLLVYDASYFETIQGGHLYRIKPGKMFKDALQWIIVIILR